VLFFFISTKMMPVAAGIIPFYVLAQHPHLRMNRPLAVWMIRSFLQEVPGKVLEAAANE
jgi:sorbitol/mannitol transport system permease protein